jgi:hypothetical protein
MIRTEDELEQVERLVQSLRKSLLSRKSDNVIRDGRALMAEVAWSGWWDKEPIDNPVFDEDVFFEDVRLRPEHRRLLSLVVSSVIEYRASQKAPALIQRCTDYLAARGKSDDSDAFTRIDGLPIEVDYQARKLRRHDKPNITVQLPNTEWSLFECATEAYPNAIDRADLEARYSGELSAKRAANASLNKRLTKFGVKVFRNRLQGT